MPQKTAHACACAVYVYTHFTSQFTRYVNCNANSFIQHPSPHLSPIHGSSARMSHRQPTQVPEDPSMRPGSIMHRPPTIKTSRSTTDSHPKTGKTVKRRRNPEDTEQRGDADLHNLQCIRVDEYHRRVKCQNIRHDKSGNRQPRRIERRFHRRRFRDRGTRISCQCHRRCDIRHDSEIENKRNARRPD